jgi:hypothetical protein
VLNLLRNFQEIKWGLVPAMTGIVGKDESSKLDSLKKLLAAPDTGDLL